MLSNFLHTSVPTHQPSAARKLHNPYNAVNEVPVIPPPAAPTSRPTSKDQSRPNSSDQLTPTPRPVSMPGPELLKASGTGTKKLEDTLSTYLLALEARKGNFVGKVLRNRTYADELAVNELYNSLLEDPNMMVLAAQASIDVLFAAFEKFLNIGWKEHFGAVLPLSTLREIQSKAESLFPSDFATYFRSTFNNMAPHNQRALKGVIKLLAELLDGTGNDGDRGILTAAFAETLFPEPEPYTFVSLLDRFVEDIESLFGESVQVQDIKPSPRPTYGHSRSQSANTGSLTSNTSSLRKKFGFSTVTRENSKSEHDSRVGSVWRQLSKSTRDRDQSSSISKGTASLHRTKSTDMDMRLTPKRPVSHDRPQVLGSFPFERPASQDASTFTPNSSLNTIGEVATPQTGGPPKKKRRSSLSDLKTLQVALSESPLIPPSPARRLMSPARELEQTASQIPTPTKSASVRISNARLGSPLRERSRIPSSFRKENSPGTQQTSTVTSPQRTRSPSKQPDEVTITSHTVVRRANITSNIPTLTPRGERPTPSTITRTGLSERPNSGNAMKIKVPSSPTKAKENDQQPATSTTPTSSPPKKLRMQSPQKLHERLHTEQKALTATHSSLQDELSKIGDELGALGPGRMGSVRANRSPHAASTLRTPSTAPADLAARLTALESSLPKLLASLTQRTDAIAEDLRSSLAVSEAKARNLDELYREANAENEALYARFNDELGRVLKVVRGGEGVEELRRLVGEGQEEVGRLRRENARLKREVGGLRAQLRE
ncbi:hypothetical protein M8818_000900 [Zalaria obscura]|uniref:Uncharacterized protein n=1 Tax=Zalaria obscura TaxID=2024903 RepID=A0ACC3SN42_9PEZI